MHEVRGFGERQRARGRAGASAAPKVDTKRPKARAFGNPKLPNPETLNPDLCTQNPEPFFKPLSTV